MKNWSLSKKIWAVLGLLAFAFVGSTYFGLSRLARVRDSLVEITSTDMKRDQLTSEIQLNQRQITSLTLESIVLQDPEDLKKNAQKFGEFRDKQKKDIASYEELASEKGKEILGQYVDRFNAYMGYVERIRKHAIKNENEQAAKLYVEADEEITKMRTHIRALNEMTGTQLAEKSKEANSMASQAIFMGIAVSTVSIFISMLIAFFVLRAVTRSINEVVKALFDSSLQVSSAAGQIASSSEELSQAATEQAASLEETAASIEEMNSMVNRNSENANSASQTSTQSQNKAMQGKSVVERMIQSMDAINESNNTIMVQINQSNENMAGIVKVIEEIGTKTKVINDIVFQTKLLSFNASVEAARAGEHGKGFAVVAEEVGNLAQMSGNAAQEISSMLDDSIKQVNQIVTTTKSSVEKLVAEGKETVDNGSRVAKECGDVLEEIVHNVANVSSMATDIASASQEQSRGVNEITKAMGQLDQMTQQNAAVSEECASSAEELSAQAEALKNAVGQLVVTINGANHKTEAHVHTAAPVKHETVRKEAPKAQAGAAPSKVLHLKGPSKTAEPAPVKKAAGGEVPSFDHEGFDDI
jgi:methyl-accepting chemotaxis protein